MSTAATNPTRRLKRASAILLLVGIVGVAVFLITVVAYVGMDNGSYSITGAQNTMSMVAFFAGAIGWPALFASAIVRIVAAIIRP